MNDQTKKCPMCAEEIPLEAKVCEYCGTRFDITEKGGLVESRSIEEPVKQPVPVTLPPAPAAKQSTPWGWIAGGLGLLLLVVVVVIVLGSSGALSLPFFATPTNTPRPTFTPRPAPKHTSTPEIQEFTVNVPANSFWFDTGIQIHQGQNISFTASGTISTWTGNPEADSPSPNGNGSCQMQDNSNCLLNGAPYGALIGKIGNEEPFLIGSSLGLKAPEDGPLYLAVNDNQIYYDDNSGSYFVTIKLDNHIGCENGEWSRSYSDSFDIDQKWWWTGFWDDEWVTSTNTIENSKYRIAAAAKQPDIVFFDDIGFKAMEISDFYATVEAQHISGPGSAEIGLMFRWVDWENHYWAGLSKDGKFYLGITRDGELITLVDSEVSTYRPDGTNNITLSATGTHITASINNESVADLYDGTFTTGKFNVYIWLEQAEDSGVFDFDNFELCLP